VAGYSGDAGNALMITHTGLNFQSNGKMFSTPDSDNDEWAYGSCAAEERCGWWFGECSSSNLNKYTDGIWTTGDDIWDVYFSRMLVKLN